MATEKQMAANKANAQKSTGPKTEEGKAASRGNAVTHGLSSKIVFPHEFEEAKQKRLDAFRPVFQPNDAHQEYQLGNYVDASLQFDNCRATVRRKLEKLAEIAVEGAYEWHAQCNDEAVKIGRSLSRDPEKAVSRLRKTPAGRHWLLQNWQTLAIALKIGDLSRWTKELSNQALDLLGYPAKNRDLIIAQGELFDEFDVVATIVNDAITELNDLSARNNAKEDLELRMCQAEGCPMVEDANLTKLLRYTSNASRRMRDALALLNKPPVLKLPPYPKDKTNPIASQPVAKTNPIPDLPIEPTGEVAEAGIESEVAGEEEVASKPKGNARYRKQMKRREREKARQADREAKQQAG